MKIISFVSAVVLALAIAGFAFLPQDADDGRVSIQLLSDPFPMSIGQVNLKVSVTDGAGKPIEGAEVKATTQYSRHSPITVPARKYENDVYYVPLTVHMVGEINVTIDATLPDGATLSEEYYTFIYGIAPHDVDSKPYRSEREIAEEVANAPDNEYWIVVPQGAQEFSGLYVDAFIPETISLSLSGQDTLVIRNDDLVQNNIGPFVVAPGETLRQRFNEPGRFIGECSLSQGIVTIEVTE